MSVWDERILGLNLRVFGLAVGFILGFAFRLATSPADPALQWSIEAGVDLPYGRLWELLNPFWQVDALYRVFVGFVFFGTALGYWYMASRGWLSQRVFLMYVMTCVMLYSMHGPQNITIVALAPLVGRFPYLALIGVFQKLPVGWSWDLSDGHWLCAWRPDKVVYNNVFLCGPRWQDLSNQSLWLNLTVYGLLFGWFGYTLWRRFRDVGFRRFWRPW